MKRTLSAVAVAFALVSGTAQAQSFPDGYTVLSAEDLAPRPGAVSEWEIRQHFPKPSFRTSSALSPQDLAPRSDAESAERILADFPQAVGVS